ncbi:YadA-like family protein [Burkholderia cenocepacia]|uniref:ESPR-type extended signal peptide-containing protein n=1 Tax=Burkholderia cenocepacia TaxID=95486 RepID=UPI001B99F569|nr:YadA-like family protein [Burkholderia cenocepacia]MBR8328741.1 YadA-like family protein [Burkholderia cenocepacia]
MNKMYRSIWNAVTNTWTAAAETAKSNSKGSSRAARQAVIAIALGSASIGGAMAADVCTAEDGSSGTVDAAGVCKAAGGSAIGTMGTIGTTAALDDAYIKVNGTVAATATATGAIAIGHNATANATGAAYQAVAIGTNASASGNALAVGASSDAANRGVAIGGAASAAANRSTAIGYITKATGDSSIAIGASANALGDNSTVLGTSANAQGSGSIAIGQAAAVVNNSGAVALGTNSSVSADYGVAIGGAIGSGRAAEVSGARSVALGTLSSAGAADAVALGYGSVADRANTVSVGAAIPNGDGRTITRQIVNVAAGTEDNDAVNVGQMNAGLSTTNASIAATNSALSTTNASLSTTNATLSTTNSSLSTTNATLSTTNSQLASLQGDMTAAQTGISTNTSDITKLGDKLSELSSGTIGLVQQADPGDDITVGANTDGNAVNFSSKTSARKLTGVAAGDVSTASNEAVNGSQLYGVSDSVAKAIGGDSVVNANGSISAPIFKVGDGSGGTKIVNSVGDAVTNLDGRTTINEGDIKKLADDIGSGTLGLVQQANPGDDITVGANTDGNAVNFSSKTSARKLTGVAAGDVSTASNEAVNGSQLYGVSDSIAKAIGGDSVVNADGSISAPVFKVGDGSGGTKIVNSVGDAVTNLDGRVTNNEGDIKKLADDIGSGTLGLVQQAKPGDDITVGSNTDGNAVNFSSKTGARKLTGVAAGDVSVGSTEAINGAQLHGISESVASAIGGSSIVNPDGSISAPTFTVGDGSGGTRIVNSVGDAVTNLDGRVTNNEGDIKKLASDIGSGTLGLVQQAKPGDDITVGASTDGNAVNFTSKTGTRKLTGIAAGDVSAASNEAVNGAQLHGVSESVAAAIGGSSIVNPDGSISAPSFKVGDGSGGTKIVNSVGDVVTNLDGRMTTNEGGLKKLSEQLENGSLGLVQQNSAGTITVGALAGGTSVNFTGADGARVLSGVANGVDDDDVVTVSQLRATGLIDYTGKEVGAVTYDSGLNFDTVTFAGTFGTKLQRVAAGEISATSMDAVNGSQLFDLQEQFAKQYGDLSGQLGDLSSRFGDLSDRLGDLEANPGTGGPGTGDGSTVVGEGAVASGENSSAIGDSALASGENASAVGQGAVASGNNGSAIGQGSVASGENGSALGQGAVASGENGTALGQGSAASGANGTAVGQGAVASGENSTSLGQGASATGSGSVAIGQGSVATEANTVSFGDGTAEGNRRLVNIADGINASDAATKGQLDRAMESVDARFNDTNRAINDVAKNAYAGIAAAMAMPNMTPSQPGKTVVAVGAANFKSGSAIAAGATYRSRNGNWLVNGATSITSVGDVGVRAQVGYEF